jgi:hypothetical protein
MPFCSLWAAFNATAFSRKPFGCRRARRCTSQTDKLPLVCSVRHSKLPLFTAHNLRAAFNATAFQANVVGFWSKRATQRGGRLVLHQLGLPGQAARLLLGGDNGAALAAACVSGGLGHKVVGLLVNDHCFSDDANLSAVDR